MAVTHTGEESLRLLDYLLIAREATSVEITEGAKSLEPLDDTPFGLLDLRVLKLNRLCLRLGSTVCIDERPSEDLATASSSDSVLFSTSLDATTKDSDGLRRHHLVPTGPQGVSDTPTAPDRGVGAYRWGSLRAPLFCA